MRPDGPAETRREPVMYLNIVPKHDVTDEQKFNDLVAVFEAAGEWPADTPAVLVVGTDALTGSHRLAAAHAAGLTEDMVPTIDLEEDGVDFETIGWTIDEVMSEDDDTLAELLRRLGRDDLAALATS